MNLPHLTRNSIPSILAAGLCLALGACEPNKAPPQATPDQQDAPTIATAAKATPQAPAVQELDATARNAESTPSKLCNLESMDGRNIGGEVVALSAPATTEFRGWIGDEATGKRPVDARLRFAAPGNQQAWELPVGAPIPRKDVADYMKIPTLGDAGFQVSADLTALPQGEYHVYLVFGGPTGGHRCDNGRRIVR